MLKQAKFELGNGVSIWLANWIGKLYEYTFFQWSSCR